MGRSPQVKLWLERFRSNFLRHSNTLRPKPMSGMTWFSGTMIAMLTEALPEVKFEDKLKAYTVAPLKGMHRFFRRALKRAFDFARQRLKGTANTPIIQTSCYVDPIPRVLH